MNAHVDPSLLPTLQRSLPEIVAEYDQKKAAIPAVIKAFQDAGNALKEATTIGGAYGGAIDAGHVYQRDLEHNLRTSAWRHVYEGLNIALLSSPKEQNQFKQAIEQPPEFTMDNIRATFGRYLKNPRHSMLRALAEVFCSLDPAYKSHDKVKIGVAGLPKRVILSGFGEYSYSTSYGREQLKAMLNALAVYQGKSLIDYADEDALMKDGGVMLSDYELPSDRHGGEPRRRVARGIRLKRFANGNGHIFFEPSTLQDINMALAEFYGDVLPDTTEEKPDKPRAGTAVAKDLQFYATPLDTIEHAFGNVYFKAGQRALDPSCGDGRLLTFLRSKGAIPYGIEVDPGRAKQATAKGHRVLCANFLECEPRAEFDHIVMNPPFYGKHYAKHVLHAMKFLKPGGRLTAILPITARYDHHLLDEIAHSWSDLPVGSFSESGTNINTTVLTAYASS